MGLSLASLPNSEVDGIVPTEQIMKLGLRGYATCWEHVHQKTELWLILLLWFQPLALSTTLCCFYSCFEYWPWTNLGCRSLQIISPKKSILVLEPSSVCPQLQGWEHIVSKRFTNRKHRVKVHSRTEMQICQRRPFAILKKWRFFKFIYRVSVINL